MNLEDQIASVISAFDEGGDLGAARAIIATARDRFNGDDSETAAWLLGTIMSVFELSPSDLPAIKNTRRLTEQVRAVHILLLAAVQSPEAHRPPDATVQ